MEEISMEIMAGDIRARVILTRLLEKMQKYPEISENIGLTDVSRMTSGAVEKKDASRY